MRRKDKEITEIGDKIEVIKKCKVCRIGLSENNMPYIVPLNYGWDFENNSLTLFFHSAKEGKKIDIMKANDNVCFEIDCDSRLIKKGEKVCNYGYVYKSIIGFGKMIILENVDEKANGLNMILKHQTEMETAYSFMEEELRNVCVYKMIVEEFTGKES